MRNIKPDYTKINNFHHVIQPIMNLSNNALYGFEVLLRSPYFQNPGLLFKYAMENNQLFALDMKSISKALHTFNKQSLSTDYGLIHINILPSTLMNASFMEQFCEITSNIHIDPKTIVFEINESEVLKESEFDSFKQAISALKRQGFLIALDDIGKGDVTIKMYLEMDPDIVKIDRYFAKNLSKSPKKQHLIESLVRFFEKEAVVLEGLESREDVHIAKELGVPLGQGFELGKPKPLSYYS